MRISVDNLRYFRCARIQMLPKYFFPTALVFLLFFSLTIDSFSQTKSDSSGFFIPQNRINKLQLESTKHLNTVNFLGELFYKIRYSDFSAAISAQNSLAYFNSASQSYRTSQRLKLASDYAVTDLLKAGFLLNRNYFNDDKRLAISNAEVNQGMLYASVNYDNLWVNVFGGLATNIQGEVEDKGYVYGAEGSLKNFSIENQRINGKFHFSNEDISPRKNYSRRFDFSLASYVSPTFTNYLRGGYGEERRDFYIPIDENYGDYFGTDNNIERRVERNIFAEEKMSFYFSKSLLFDFSGSLATQNIGRNKKYVLPEDVTVSSFDPKTDRFILDFSGKLNYVLPSSNLFLKVNYHEKEETFSVYPIDGASDILFQLRQAQEERKNNTSRIVYVSAGGDYEISSRDKIAFSLFHRKLIYDTPSEENFDDRDELLTMVRLRYTRKFSYLFKMNFDIEGSFNHVVYIFAERSANNNIKRILKFAAEGIYEGKNVTSKNSAEISANYTVYDFEDLLQNFQSFAFRQAVFRDSSTVKFSSVLGLKFFGYLKLAEQGEFNWNSFSEKPFQFRREVFAEPILFSSVYFVNFGLGARIFLLDISNYSGLSLIPYSSYSSVGPSFWARTIFNGKLNFSLHGWYEFIRGDNNLKDENLNFNLNFLWRI